MAFGIDDALATAAAGISLTDTIVQTIKRYNQSEQDPDFELLLEEVRVTTLRKINEADLALTQFERILHDKGVDTSQRLSDVIATTSFWKPFEQRQMTQLHKQFNEFSDNIYSAGDDIAALARCREMTRDMGLSVVDSAKEKHELAAKLLNAASLQEAIGLLRQQLVKYKVTLTESRPRPRGRAVRTA